MAFLKNIKEKNLDTYDTMAKFTSNVQLHPKCFDEQIANEDDA